MSAADAVPAGSDAELRVSVDEAEVRRLVPHAQRMCLLQAVVACDAGRIICRSDTHRLAGHPLADAEGRLSLLHLVEYGAQAAALHEALTAAARRGDGEGQVASIGGPAPGMLVAVRELRLGACDDLAALAGALFIEGWKSTASGSGSSYRFEARCDGAWLAGGRLLVMRGAT